tara:strand:- start:1210 stop:1530 length:321 start_codon:yes stop_codon:yes gene_type:complete
MNTSYSKYNMSIKINSELSRNETIMVYWSISDENFDVREEGDWDDITEDNLIGIYTSWITTAEVLADCDDFLIELDSHDVDWPDVDQTRLAAIGQNGNDGLVYENE